MLYLKYWNFKSPDKIREAPISLNLSDKTRPSPPLKSRKSHVAAGKMADREV